MENVEGKKMTRQKRNEAPRRAAPMAYNGSKRKADGRVMSGKTSMTEKKSDTKIDDVDTSFLPVKKFYRPNVSRRAGRTTWLDTILEVFVFE